MASVYLQREEDAFGFLLEDGTGKILLEAVRSDYNRRIRRENLKRKIATHETHIRAYAKPQ